MTAQDKFEARLKELGIDLNEAKTSSVTGVETQDFIVVMVHYYGTEDDPYSEYHYPRFDTMSQGNRSLLTDHFSHEYYSGSDKEDAKFLRKLAIWCADGKKECPLFPSDCYLNIEPSLDSFVFEDDAPKKSSKPSFEDLKKHLIGVEDEAYASIYQTYRESIVASAEESIFNLNDTDDVKLLLDHYTIKEIADISATGCKYVLDGTNFDILFPVTSVRELVKANWDDIYASIKADPDLYHLDVDVDNFVISDEDEYAHTLEANAEKLAEINGQLAKYASDIVSMIRGELKRGHNLQADFDPHPGWDTTSFYGFFIDGKTFKVWERADGLMFLALEQDGYETINIILNADDFPIEVLIHIYESMK